MPSIRYHNPKLTLMENAAINIKYNEHIHDNLGKEVQAALKLNPKIALNVLNKELDVQFYGDVDVNSEAYLLGLDLRPLVCVTNGFGNTGLNRLSCERIADSDTLEEESKRYYNFRATTSSELVSEVNTRALYSREVNKGRAKIFDYAGYGASLYPGGALNPANGIEVTRTTLLENIDPFTNYIKPLSFASFLNDIGVVFQYDPKFFYNYFHFYYRTVLLPNLQFWVYDLKNNVSEFSKKYFSVVMLKTLADAYSLVNHYKYSGLGDVRVSSQDYYIFNVLLGNSVVENFEFFAFKESLSDKFDWTRNSFCGKESSFRGMLPISFILYLQQTTASCVPLFKGIYHNALPIDNSNFLHYDATGTIVTPPSDSWYLLAAYTHWGSFFSSAVTCALEGLMTKADFSKDVLIDKYASAVINNTMKYAYEFKGAIGSATKFIQGAFGHDPSSGKYFKAGLYNSASLSQGSVSLLDLDDSASSIIYSAFVKASLERLLQVFMYQDSVYKAPIVTADRSRYVAEGYIYFVKKLLAITSIRSVIYPHYAIFLTNPTIGNMARFLGASIGFVGFGTVQTVHYWTGSKLESTVVNIFEGMSALFAEGAEFDHSAKEFYESLFDATFYKEVIEASGIHIVVPEFNNSLIPFSNVSKVGGKQVAYVYSRNRVDWFPKLNDLVPIYDEDGNEVVNTSGFVATDIEKRVFLDSNFAGSVITEEEYGEVTQDGPTSLSFSYYAIAVPSLGAFFDSLYGFGRTYSYLTQRIDGIDLGKLLPLIDSRLSSVIGAVDWLDYPAYFNVYSINPPKKRRGFFEAVLRFIGESLSWATAGLVELKGILTKLGKFVDEVVSSIVRFYQHYLQVILDLFACTVQNFTEGVSNIVEAITDLFAGESLDDAISISWCDDSNVGTYKIFNCSSELKSLPRQYDAISAFSKISTDTTSLNPVTGALDTSSSTSHRLIDDPNFKASIDDLAAIAYELYRGEYSIYGTSCGRFAKATSILVKVVSIADGQSVYYSFRDLSNIRTQQASKANTRLTRKYIDKSLKTTNPRLFKQAMRMYDLGLKKDIFKDMFNPHLMFGNTLERLVGDSNDIYSSSMESKMLLTMYFKIPIDIKLKSIDTAKGITPSISHTYYNELYALNKRLPGMFKFAGVTRFDRDKRVIEDTDSSCLPFCYSSSDTHERIDCPPSQSVIGLRKSGVCRMVGLNKNAKEFIFVLPLAYVKQLSANELGGVLSLTLNYLFDQAYINDWVKDNHCGEGCFQKLFSNTNVLVFEYIGAMLDTISTDPSTAVSLGFAIASGNVPAIVMTLIAATLQVAARFDPKHASIYSSISKAIAIYNMTTAFNGFSETSLLAQTNTVLNPINFAINTWSAERKQDLEKHAQRVKNETYRLENANLPSHKAYEARKEMSSPEGIHDFIYTQEYGINNSTVDPIKRYERNFWHPSQSAFDRFGVK